MERLEEINFLILEVAIIRRDKDRCPPDEWREKRTRLSVAARRLAELAAEA